MPATTRLVDPVGEPAHGARAPCPAGSRGAAASGIHALALDRVHRDRGEKPMIRFWMNRKVTIVSRGAGLDQRLDEGVAHASRRGGSTSTAMITSGSARLGETLREMRLREAQDARREVVYARRRSLEPLAQPRPLRRLMYCLSAPLMTTSTKKIAHIQSEIADSGTATRAEHGRQVGDAAPEDRPGSSGSFGTSRPR